MTQQHQKEGFASTEQKEAATRERAGPLLEEDRSRSEPHPRQDIRVRPPVTSPGESPGGGKTPNREPRKKR